MKYAVAECCKHDNAFSFSEVIFRVAILSPGMTYPRIPGALCASFISLHHPNEARSQDTKRLE
jgi:hypothetical protein